ncbi:helix-loop-helix DNA-binding domain-containing protein [Hirsutella rhossiliensis]|uniref:Helix-loop-helix DNA-binding domain-containing protein n=1 Tax=Hirsutella rhossiliensis TaxID=111463 RepID=A0A9P8MNX8_9HYPO|nr:helix-loop-helix DNA-binding domain-containing protein [Hirsutella rhossiliensis]KAH0957491.1 helix-loop-helix DNA-binding domain-containing protein [Hirsutella rhossiliensis]
MRPVETARPRRPSAARGHREASFALPPPPTRSRKIIQMNPRQGAATAAKAAASATGTDKGKKKQPNSTSAAGRKIARKTAHSLIERRRRSKMNEEFAVLKGMIPACTGEMHKLAILQASIDYVRYLEDCVDKLKAQYDEDQDRGDSTHDPLPPIRDFHPTLREDPAVGEAEMTDSDMASPELADNHDRHSQPSISPALLAQDHHHRRFSHFFTSTDLGHYGYSSSAESTLTSPILLQNDFDHEASAALLMLNKDRRGPPARGRGLSVRDLLTT